MALSPKLLINAAQPTGMLMLDSTGNYDAVANPGGWGAPNPTKASVVQILIAQSLLNAVPPAGVALSVADQAAYLTGAGATALPATGGPNMDGVYNLTALIGFVCPQA